MAAYSSGFPMAGADDPEEDEPISDDSEEERDESDILEDEDKDQPLLPGLTKELETKLINLVIEFERESFPVWRFLNRDFFEAESFWKDLQYGFYDANADIWRVPSQRDLSKVGESGQRFTYQTNLYRAFGGTIVSTIGQKLPTTRFLPVDFRRENDVQFSEAAADLTPLIERWNKIHLKNARAAYLLYNHGVVGAYTRYVEDSERFGWKEVPEINFQKMMLQEAGYECMYCAAMTPESHFLQGGFSDLSGSEGPVQQDSEGQPSEQALAPPIPKITCPNCSRPLGAINYREPEYGEVPVEVGTKLVPRGQQLITLHGGLELRLPPWCEEQADYPYLGLVLETHTSQLRATYGDRAKDLQGGWGAGPYDSWDRFARLALVEPTVSYYGTSNQNLVTFKRYWLRPSSFWLLTDKKDVEALLKIFPDGAYLAFADTKKLLDARNERLDDQWEIGNAVEGAGAYKPSLGSSVISIQKRYNTVQNFLMEWLEYAAAGAGTFFNANVINYKAMKSHRRAPGMFYPLRMGINQPISNVMMEGKPGQIAGEVFKYGDDLRSLGEFVSAAVPTVTGGTEQSLKPTTYISDKESALGRLFTAWLHLRFFWAGVMLKSVKDYARWATYDEQYSIVGPDGDAQGKVIKLENLRGDIDAYPETNEQFPVLWQQMQQTFMQLMEGAQNDPRIAEILGDLENVPFAKAMLGLPNIFVPGMDDKMKQKHEIALLLQQEPVQIQQIDPMTGQMQVIEQPSIPIDPFEDGHPVHEDTVKKWAVSPTGLKARLQRPLGYKNVILHGKMHEDYRLGLAAQMQARAEMGAQQAQQEGGDNADSQQTGTKPGVRPGSGAGANKREGQANGSKGKAEKGRSDNPGAPGGASPTQQTQQVKAGMERNLQGGIPA